MSREHHRQQIPFSLLAKLYGCHKHTLVRCLKMREKTHSFFIYQEAKINERMLNFKKTSS